MTRKLIENDDDKLNIEDYKKKWIQNITFDTTLKPTAKIVFLCILFHMEEKLLHSQLSAKDIKELINISIPTIFKSIDELEQKQYLKVIRRRREDNPMVSEVNIYELPTNNQLNNSQVLKNFNSTEVLKNFKCSSSINYNINNNKEEPLKKLSTSATDINKVYFDQINEELQKKGLGKLSYNERVKSAIGNAIKEKLFVDEFYIKNLINHYKGKNNLTGCIITAMETGEKITESSNSILNVAQTITCPNCKKETWASDYYCKWCNGAIK